MKNSRLLDEKFIYPRLPYDPKPSPLQHDDGVVVGVGGEDAVADDLAILEDWSDHDANRNSVGRFPQLLQHDVGHGLGHADRDHGVGGDVPHVEQQHGGGFFRDDSVLLNDVFVTERVRGL